MNGERLEEEELLLSRYSTACFQVFRIFKQRQDLLSNSHHLRGETD